MNTTPVHDLNDDAPRYVAEALKVTSHDWVAIDDLIDNYVLPRPNNLTEIKREIRESAYFYGDGPIDEYDVRSWLIREAITTIRQPGCR